MEQEAMEQEDAISTAFEPLIGCRQKSYYFLEKS